MSENNNNVKFQTFLLIIGVFITVVGAAFTLVWNEQKENRTEANARMDKLESKFDNKFDVLSGKIDNFMSRYDGYKSTK
jgi:Tfp pilus assembly protein PilO